MSPRQTFLSAYRAFQRGERPHKPHNWLIKIAHNVCRQRFRDSSRRPQEVEFDESLAAAATEDPDVPTATEIRRALGFLAFNQRAALVMRELEGRSYADRRVEDLCDLGVGAALELAHDERGALVESEEAERAADLGRGRDVGVLGRGCGERLVELDLLRPPRGVAEALPADVVRDLDQPVVRLVRALAALEGAVGAEERLLGDVLGVGLVVEDRERVAVDGVDVLLVEPLEGAVSGARSLREDGGHGRLDGFGGFFLRSGLATASSTTQDAVCEMRCTPHCGQLKRN